MVKELNKITETVIGAAMAVHKELGPGLLESAYEACLVFELADRGLAVGQQKPLPVKYRDVKLDCAYRLDLLVDGKVIVELKAVEELADAHHAQLLNYLKATGIEIGLLLNFGPRPDVKRKIYETARKRK